MAKMVSPVRVADGGDGAAAGPRESDSFTGNNVVAHFVEGWDGREGGREGGRAAIGYNFPIDALPLPRSR